MPEAPAKKILIYDATLRDGAQSEGITFSLEDKQEIARQLDAFGISFIEGGWPGSNPVDDEFFASLPQLGLKRTQVTAFGSTRRHNIKAADDQNMRALAASSAQWCCIFGKSSEFQVNQALRVPLEENLAMIEDSCRYLKVQGKKVMFDAEHFFDGYRTSRDYTMKCLTAAVKGGADWLVLCDTNGGSLPDFVSGAVAEVVRTYRVPVGIHAHNDSELAVANTLAAVEAGAGLIQGTINGLGERCGNANLCSIMADLVLKLGYRIDAPDLKGLTALSKSIAEIENVVPFPGLPFVGERAFAHKGGMHVSALARDPRTYEHIPPETVGNTRRVLISDMAGRASIAEKLKELGLPDDQDSPAIIERVKDLEARGYQFEGADASFELLVRRMRGEIKPRFELKGFRLFIDAVGDAKLTSEASIKVTDLNGNEEHTAADGDGPVNALDNAMRKALTAFFPVIDRIKLTDYKVRVLDGKAATAAAVRVLIRSTDGKSSWTTVGVSENVIEASLYALIDSVEYAIYKENEGNKS
ncbi:MAG: citramalate synthase [Methanomethylophilus sp.]